MALDFYNRDLRKACLEDQGTADGKPDTLGHDLQRVVAKIKKNPLLRAA